MSNTIESQVDLQIAEVTRLDGEIAHVAETIGQLRDEAQGADGALEKATAAQATIELRARLDGSKLPKSPPELESLRFAAVRLAATLKAAEAMIADLQAARAGALAEADRLAKVAAREEFAAAETEVSQAWQTFLAAFSKYSAAAYFSGREAGWNGIPAYGFAAFDVCDGLQVMRPDHDSAMYGKAIANSKAAVLREKIDAIGAE